MLISFSDDRSEADYYRPFQILLYRLSDTDDDSDEDETEGDDIPVHFERLSYVSSRLTERVCPRLRLMDSKLR